VTNSQNQIDSSNSLQQLPKQVKKELAKSSSPKKPSGHFPVTEVDRTSSQKSTTRKVTSQHIRPATPIHLGHWVVFLIFGFGMFGLGIFAGSVSGVLLFIRITGGTGDPSVPINAPTLAIPTMDHSTMSQGTPIAKTSTAFIVGTATYTPIPVAASATSSDPVPAQTVFSSPQLFRIVSTASEARFSVVETFPAGTAVGRTNQIAGDILVDFDTPSNSQLGVIRINLRTLHTDSEERNQSIRCCILLSAYEGYEFTDFVPTSMVGLPNQVFMGEPITFQVVGDLKLRDTIKPVTFDVTLTVVANALRGKAKTIIKRSDFDLIYEDHLIEHGVDENVTVEFDFVAQTVDQ
jgi:polyisoprenoid-binding protein YceI